MAAEPSVKAGIKGEARLKGNLINDPVGSLKWEEREEAYPRGRLSCHEATIGPKRNSNIQAIFSDIKHRWLIYCFFIS